MSSTTAVASGDMPQGPISTHGGDKASGDGDEELPGTQLATSLSPSSPERPSSMDLEPEILDPAILAMTVEGRTHRPYQYTRERLLELREAPLSRRRPEYLDVQHNNSQGLWDPERWHHDWKRLSPEPTDPHPGGKRRSGDPRERLRKEQDGIVLSPQRRSFNSGCFVPVNQHQPRRAESPIGGKGGEHLGVGPHRGEIAGGARRIGSGRIIARDVSWDYRPDKGEMDGPEFGFGRPAGQARERKDTDRDRDREDRYERRSFGRDFERDRERDKDRHITRNGRYNDRRRISSDSKDDEPEWFSGGPTSQADTIELRGFEDAICESDRTNGRKKPSPAQKKRNKERAITKSNDTNTSSKEDSPRGPGARSTPTPSDHPPTGPAPHSPIAEEPPCSQTGGGGTGEDGERDVGSEGEKAERKEESEKDRGKEMDFNLEEFLRMDSIPELLTNGVGNDVGTTAGSRFSRWFNKETSPVHNREEDSRRSSLQDEHLVNNIINGLGDSDTYFAPISPAATGASSVGHGQGPPAGAKPVTLLEILQRGKAQQAAAIKQPRDADMPPTTLKQMADDKNVPGKVLSLEELEARMRQGSDRSQSQEMNNQAANINRPKPDEDMSAFKRLLAQVSGGQAVAASNGPIPKHPTSIPSSLGNLQQQQPLSAPGQPMSLLQMLSKSQQDDAAARAHGMLSPGAPTPGPHVPSDLVLKLHQVQQHQRQQQQQQEMLSKLMGSGGSRQQFGIGHGDLGQGLASGRELLQRPEALAILQAMQQRIPSPRELQAHTQGIMQRALIKKKLEEQQENFRKKQEMQQRSQSPAVVNTSTTNSGVPNTSSTQSQAQTQSRGSPAKCMSSPTPLAFTPTSVLRKMTAEKDDSVPPKDAKASNENALKAQGRAVTGMRQQAAQVQPLQPQNWNLQQAKPPVGRPIVKGNNNYQFMTQQSQDYQQLQQMQQMQNQRFQQQQQQRAKLASQSQPQFNMQQQQPRGMQQMRNPLQSLQHLQQRGANANAWHQLVVGQNYDRGMPVTGRGIQLGRGSPGDGDLSPTSDQLARWFSPELLAQARAGKLPDMPPASIAQNALSLEELERIQQTTAPVHN